MNQTEIMYFIESALLASDKPLKIDKLLDLFEEDNRPDRVTIRDCLRKLQQEYQLRNIELIEVASGYRIQVKSETSKKLDKLWEWRSPRYSRALFETLALIAYKQPITRGEIEMVRGVSVSSNIIKSLMEREWIYITGQRDVPGRPEMFGTTKIFLDYFGLKNIKDLPLLEDLSDWDSVREKLGIPEIEAKNINENSKPEINPILNNSQEVIIEDDEIDENDVSMKSALEISDTNFDDLIESEHTDLQDPSNDISDNADRVQNRINQESLIYEVTEISRFHGLWIQTQN